MRQISISLTAIFLIGVFGLQNANADLIYNIVPQDLINETDSGPEQILGGTIRLVDGADADGILSASEIIEVQVENTMAGLVVAYDSFDFLNVDATFSGNLLIGNLQIQHTNTGEAFVDWGGGDLLSISNSNRTEFASAPWNSSSAIAVRAIPEPGTGLVALSAIPLVFVRRWRRCRRQE
jgi:hypothetical protein